MYLSSFPTRRSSDLLELTTACRASLSRRLVSAKQCEDGSGTKTEALCRGNGHGEGGGLLCGGAVRGEAVRRRKRDEDGSLVPAEWTWRRWKPFTRAPPRGAQRFTRITAIREAD